jgi:transcriptional regulator with GAF, ATPase, and Fis domain
MKAIDSLVVEIWREVSRHNELPEAVARLAPMLAQRLPVGLALIRRIDLARSCVETLAAGVCGGARPAQPNRSDCSGLQIEELLAWCRREEIAHALPAQLHKRLAGLIPAGVTADVLAGPLSDGEGPAGVVVLAALRGRKFDSGHERLLAALLEPLSVALQNDTRLRELSTLRETAEADRAALLTRLGRQTITDTIVGAERGLRPVLERVALVAPSHAPVLIFGETGSGKEVIARSIHARSRRSARPFLRVNCGAIPSELIDSELFGHERGSFTGAVSLRKGWFERSDGGTLFLDEVGELPAAAQVRLLRILQDGTFERVGGQQQLTVDVRIVAATHRPLQAMVSAGAFREDLWYRLAVFPIHLPPLREHAEDIPELATHFALKAARRFGTPALAPSADDLHLLLSYSWPGNIRELQSVMERATILGNGRRLEVATALGAGAGPAPSAEDHGAIRQGLRRDHDGQTADSPPTAGGTGAEPGAGETILPLAAAMARHIEAALVRTGGRIEGPSGCARLLRINPHTLRARMRKLGVDWRRFRAADQQD